MKYLSIWMQKPAIVLAGFCLFISSGVSAGRIEVLPGQENNFRITGSSFQEVRFTNRAANIKTLSVQAEGREYTRLIMEGYSRSDRFGSPELPVLREFLEVPVGAVLRVEVTRSVYRDLDLTALGFAAPVMPAQPPAVKTAPPDFVINPEVYRAGGFNTEPLVSAEILGMMRSFRIGRLDISPVQYDPVSHILRVYTEIEAVVYFDQADIGATIDLKQKYENHLFRGLGRNLVNYHPSASRDTIASYPLSYLIISDPMFQSQLQPFIQWKTKQGYKVTTAYTNDPQVGATTTAIKNFIQGKYNNPPAGEQPPSFVLLVGDIQQIPAWNGTSGSHVTDLYYFDYTNDLFPEIYYGRFSAQNPSQLQPQIDKTLQYEQYTMPDPSYLSEVVMVAGMDASHGNDWANGQINYGTINYFNASNGILSHTYLYPESGSHSADIIQDISNGVTYGNYTAHCNWDGWSDPSFNIGDIPTLQNQDQYGLLVGNCCLSSKFNESECFAEALLRVANKGAVAYIGGSNNTYWDEDYYFGVGVGEISENPPSYEETTLGMYDRAFHTHNEPWADWYTMADQHVYAGNLAVTLGAPGSATYYWEIYCLMGDPSLQVYYSEPSPMTVSHLPLMPLNSASFTVECEPYAYVGISVGGVLKGAALADASGLAEVPLTPITSPGTADVVVTAQNFQPYFGTVIVANPEGPYILVNGHTERELSGYVNNKMECGEVVAIDLELRNYGLSDGLGVEATLFSSDQYITITDSREFCGTVPAQSISTITNAFSIVISDLIPDGHVVGFTVQLEDAAREIWTSEMTLSLVAPVLHLNSLVVDDSETGNGNGRLDAGESADIIATFSNQGHSIARNTVAELCAHSGFINIINPVHQVGNLGFFGNTPVTFQVEVDSKAPNGILCDFIVGLESGAFELQEVKPMKIGLISEDFESGNFTAFSWSMGGSLPWIASNQFPYAGFYSARSGVVTHGQSSELSLGYYVMQPDSLIFTRKVSSEAGDKLRFLVDGTVMGEWSGTTGGWKRESFFITPGNHTFKWVYSKDGSGSSGADAAWIDNIVFPPALATIIYAGEDVTLCPGGVHQCLGIGTNYQSVNWTTSGSGSFDLPQSLIPLYTPSAEDYANGGVDLTLQILSSDGESFTDQMDLDFQEIPVPPDMPSGPEYVLADTTFISEFSVLPVSGADSYLWIVDPASAGYFTGNGTSGILVWNRAYAGTALIGAVALNECGGGNTSPWLSVTVENTTVGLDENLEPQVSVKAFPNPVSGVLHVSVSGQGDLTLEARLVNMLGSVVTAPTKILSSQLDIPVGQLPPGIYFLVINSSREQIVRKIIVR